MHYHVSRDGQQLGRISEAELKAGLFDGRYLATDLAWKEGMGQWTPLGELFGAPPVPVPVGRGSVAAPSAVPSASLRQAPSRQTSFGQVSFAGQAPKSGLALTSLIFGILSIVFCGLGGVGTLVAIICGHRALSRINQSGGVMAGRGMALAGLILGYISILTAIIEISMTAAIAVPVFVKVQEKGMEKVMVNNANQLQLACKSYAATNNGSYPETLEVLVEKGLLDAAKLQQFNSFKPSMWDGEPGFEYLGAGKSDSTTLAETEILVSKAQGKRGERIVSYHDGSTMLVKPPK